MKKLVFILLMSGLGAGLQAQNKNLEKLFDRYSDRDSATSVVINKNMFQLFANNGEEGDNFMKTVKNLDFIKILSVKGPVESKAFYQDLTAAVPEKDYKELMTMKENDMQVRFVTLEKDGMIRELVMISRQPDETSFIWMSGIIDMKTVSKIAESMNIQGMENLDKTKKKE
jgi:hypothetical protein